MKALQARLLELREASVVLRNTTTAVKNLALTDLAQRLVSDREKILAANRRDLKALPRKAAPAFRDRLMLDNRRIDAMAESLWAIAALPDPVGELVDERRLSNGLRARRVRAPLGVILMIYESRPNVAIEAFGLAFKSGNAIILRGGRESAKTVAVLYKLIGESLSKVGVGAKGVWGVTSPGRALVTALLKQRDAIDVVVPRGGEGLIRAVENGTRIPVIKNDRGLCHVYVHEDADLVMAKAVVTNAKVQRPGVCNSMETLLVHERVATEFLPRLHEHLSRWSVQWKACPVSQKILKGRSGVKRARDSDWDTEHLDLILNCRVVRSYEEAAAHISSHGSRHSESIITRSEAVARRFQNEIDAAAVYWNASTRFTDGFELGLGGELGISTQKLHVRGPVGLRELTSARWVMDGSGQTRGELPA